MKKGCRSAVITYTAFPSETDRHCTACHSWSDCADIGHHPFDTDSISNRCFEVSDNTGGMKGYVALSSD